MPLARIAVYAAKNRVVIMLNQQIGAFEAKTHFSQIIDKVMQGADFIVTRRGKPVAKIVPIENKPEMTFQEAVAKLTEMRKLYRGKPGSFNIREAIEDGRR
jgi:prevent-host-death family protein